ncbi:uncharacterized protein LOC117643346 [Thrips palmi]|uniref:Uncharacterized protein LOC117643346 n=1 Tax=Thrips palmi TaxID=161013 RepID=A0A6P8YVD3_THRPL|nr:uncharacterized protein LOC117643346 [Thrips palmi]
MASKRSMKICSIAQKSSADEHNGPKPKSQPTQPLRLADSSSKRGCNSKVLNPNPEPHRKKLNFTPPKKSLSAQREQHGHLVSTQKPASGTIDLERSRQRAGLGHLKATLESECGNSRSYLAEDSQSASSQQAPKDSIKDFSSLKKPSDHNNTISPGSGSGNQEKTRIESGDQDLNDSNTSLSAQREQHGHLVSTQKPASGTIDLERSRQRAGLGHLKATLESECGNSRSYLAEDSQSASSQQAPKDSIKDFSSLKKPIDHPNNTILPGSGSGNLQGKTQIESGDLDLDDSNTSLSAQREQHDHLTTRTASGAINLERSGQGVGYDHLNGALESKCGNSRSNLEEDSQIDSAQQAPIDFTKDLPELVHDDDPLNTSLETSFTDLLKPNEKNAWEDDISSVTVLGIQTESGFSFSSGELQVDSSPIITDAIFECLSPETPSSQIVLEVREAPVENLDTSTADHDISIDSTPESRKRTRSATPRSGSPVRKRSRNSALWKTNIRKTAANSGQEYVSARGKLVKARQMRLPCSCKLDCVHRLSEEQRKKVFDTFWQLASHDRQWEFIRNFSVNKPTKGKDDQEPKKRKCSRSYFFEVDGETITVCKKMFMCTLDIWDGWIDSAYSHVNPQKGKVATPDKRGRHANHPKVITPEKIKTVTEHVAEFPRVPSHYCRASTKREYLQRGLSLRKMAKLYQSWAESKNLPHASRATIRQYIDIVNLHFNLGFFKPKKDQCKLCVFMGSKHNTPRLKAQYKDIYATHIKNKQRVKKIKEQDKAAAEKDRTIALCSFDLQKQLNLPHSQASPFYYHSKLTLYNFTVFHSIKRLGCCFLWHEGMAKKGSNEISSSLLYYISELVKEGYKELIFYSDNCGGQNKNRFIFSMLQLAAVRYSVKITHRFLETGHTMMEVDSIHARIENSTEFSELFDFDDWIKAIEDAKEELPKYEVIPFKKGFVRTFKPLVETLQTWEKDMKGNKIQWQKVKEICINGAEGNKVHLKYDYDGETVTLNPNKPGRPVNLKTYQPPQAYEGAIPLPASTIAGIKKFCKEKDIPELKQPFYDDVLAGCWPTDEDAASDVEDDPMEALCVGDALEEETNKGEGDREEEDEERAEDEDDEDDYD